MSEDKSVKKPDLENVIYDAIEEAFRNEMENATDVITLIMEEMKFIMRYEKKNNNQVIKKLKCEIEYKLKYQMSDMKEKIYGYIDKYVEKVKTVIENQILVCSEESETKPPNMNQV